MTTQRPPVHGTPLQQSPLVVQIWPYDEQGVPESGMAASAPASTGGGMNGLQVPDV